MNMEGSAAARAERRMKWWGENKKKVQHNENEDSPVKKPKPPQVITPNADMRKSGFRSKHTVIPEYHSLRDKKVEDGDDEKLASPGSPKKHVKREQQVGGSDLLVRDKYHKQGTSSVSGSKLKRKLETDINKGQKRMKKSTENVSASFSSPDVSVMTVNKKEKADDVDYDVDCAEGVEGGKSGDANTEVKLTQKKKKKKRDGHYVLFLGNIPFNASKEDIEKHFVRSGPIKDVRLLTNSKTGRSRGCAYIEFFGQQTFRTGLMMHKSKFKGRELNVEFTSAGRKTERRMARLKEKNESLARFKMPDETFTGPQTRHSSSKNMYFKDR